MGVTIHGINSSIDLPYSAFARLRMDVAGRCPEDIATHYKYLIDHIPEILHDEKEAAEYDAETEALFEKYKSKGYTKVLSFLHASDADADFGYGTAKQLLKLFESGYEDKVIGYAGWGDKAARLSDFIRILQDAAETKTRWGWY